LPCISDCRLHGVDNLASCGEPEYICIASWPATSTCESNPGAIFRKGMSKSENKKYPFLEDVG
jgi:hypothetical protein